MLAVTGVTGHTGRNFINELVKNHYDEKVRCLVRTISKAVCVMESGLDCEVIEGSLDNEKDIYLLLSGADTVLHIANIHYSTEIIRIGRACNVKRFILVHTTGIFSKYKAASKDYIEIENQILPFLEEWNITILRPTMIFGDICDYNISKFIAMIDHFPIVPVISSGNSLIQPVNARDLAQAYFKVLRTESSAGKAYNLSGERAVSVRELYCMIMKELKKKRIIISLPMRMCIFIAKMIRIMTNRKIDIIEKVERMGENRSFSHEDATRDFGYMPETFEIGLHREVEEYIAKKR